jgi:hypothetical protein
MKIIIIMLQKTMIMLDCIVHKNMNILCTNRQNLKRNHSTGKNIEQNLLILRFRNFSISREREITLRIL